MVKAASLALFGIFATVSSFGQVRPGEDSLHFQSNVGSFKLLDGGPGVPARGRLEMSFTGTVLITGLEGTVTPTGNVRREYESKEHKKQCFFGVGSIVIEGKFNSVQWFGRNMAGTFKGLGIMRLYGEYDKNLDTGKYWYDATPNKKELWLNGGRTVLVPMPEGLREIKPKVRDGS